MKDDEFYWGSAYKSARADDQKTKIDGTKVTITIPEEFDKLPRLHGKYSYHESGTIHYKTQLQNGIFVYDEHSKWRLKGEITKPVRFYTIISRTLNHYDAIIKNPTKGKTYAQALKFDHNVADKRVYFEFFLSPEGTFNIPETLIKFNKPATEVMTHSLSKNLILIVRFVVVTNLKDWHPDKEIAIIPNDLK